MTPGQKIRKVCIRCVASTHGVRNCGGNKMLGQGDKDNVCWFYPYRMGRGRPSVKIVRRSCLECMGGSRKLVKNCGESDCPVHPFRMGRNPNYTQNRNREQGDDKNLFESAA